MDWMASQQEANPETTQDLLEAEAFDRLSRSNGYAAAPTNGAPERSGVGLLAALIALAVALVAGYGFGASWFSSHLLPNTSVNGEFVGGMDRDALARSIDAEYAGWSTEITSPDFSLDVSAADIALDVDDAAYAEEAFSQQPSSLAWPIELLRSHACEVEPKTSYSAEQLESTVRQAVDAFNETASDPTPPVAAYDKERHEFVVTSGEYGTKLVADQVVSQVNASMADLPTSIELTEDALVAPPSVEDSEHLAQLAAWGNSLVGLDIPITLDGEERTRIGRDEIGSWIRLDGEWGPYVSEDAVQEWIVGTLVPLLD